MAASSNRLTATAGPAPAQNNAYDAAGNLTSNGTASFTYSDRGRLARATVGANQISYLYNGLGQRVSKQGPAALIPTGTTLYTYDEGGRLIGEYDATPRSRQETVYLGDTPVAVLTQSVSGSPAVVTTSVHYVWADHIDTPRVITQASDNRMRWRWDQADPFGVAAPNQNPANVGAFAYNPRFPGQLYDAESNLHYNYFRDYDPRVGRYTQSDPIGLAGGINTYAYVGGNPLMYVDPNGLQAIPLPPIPVPGVPNPSADAQQQLAQQLTGALRRAFPERTYQTYTRYNPRTGTCYSGRTSGYDDPLANIRKRALGQLLLNAEGFLPPVLDRSSPNWSAIRGREQQLIDINGGARSGGGTSRNMINGISPINPFRAAYLDEATGEFGTPVPAENCTCQ